MKPHYSDERVTVYTGDCIEVLRALPDASVDSVVTDPPYGLEFMGKDWDSFSPVDLDRGGRWTKDKRGTAGKLHDDTGRAYGRVAYGANRSYTSECRTCGRRDAFRNPHDCSGEPRWERTPVDEGAPPQMVAFGQWCELWAAEALRVLKPGGHLLAFGGTRTWHRLAVAIEDAGFEIRDSIAWMYGSGFPKSLDVSKAIDKAAGAEREVVGTSKGVSVSASDNKHGGINRGAVGVKQVAVDLPVTAPATPAAQQWQGWGTALKPAHEPIVVARKPLIGTVAANVLEHGTGALNIDGCRIGFASDEVETQRRSREAWAKSRREGKTGEPGAGSSLAVAVSGDSRTGHEPVVVPPGRWPANVVLDEDQAAALDKQSGYQKDGVAVLGNRQREYDASAYMIVDNREGSRTYGGAGGASRFFYVAKAPARERPKVDGVAHPTVKPLTLMRWLCRLVTPTGGVILEPFAGSGTTIEAALHEGFNVIAIEREADYLPLIDARLARYNDETDGQLPLAT